MKKYFMFVAVAAAGMLASCSSESLTAGSDPKIEPTQEERVPIQLGVSAPSVNLASGTTRGTGTVGGVGVANDDPTNVWYGQEINAFMFDKGTLNLAIETTTPSVTYFYNDALMITPGTADNRIPGLSTPTNIGEAMLSNGDIKYYPAYGNFDFFGYHGDDAITGALDDSADPWTVPFTITGSQDLMSTKAELTPAQTTALGGSTDFYSAKAARKEVQPILSFDHLLTRLAFEVKAGNDNAGGWVLTTPAVLYADVTEYNTAKGTTLTAEEFAALSEEEKTKTAAVYDQDPTLAVHVESIEVNSKTTGKMAVAWTGDAPEEMITWTGDGTPDWLALKERPAYYETAHATNTISTAAYNLLDDDISYKNINDNTDIIDQSTYDSKSDEEKAEYEIVNTCKAAYTAFGADVANSNLIALTPAYPVLTKSTTDANPDDPTPIGEALIVAPSTEAYQMKVNVSQLVPLNWTGTPAPDVKYQNYDLEIPAPDGGFKANTSYKVVLTVYGFERIKVTTEIIPWTPGSTIPVGQD